MCAEFLVNSIPSSKSLAIVSFNQTFNAVAGQVFCNRVDEKNLATGHLCVNKNQATGHLRVNKNLATGHLRVDKNQATGGLSVDK